MCFVLWYFNYCVDGVLGNKMRTDVQRTKFRSRKSEGYFSLFCKNFLYVFTSSPRLHNDEELARRKYLKRSLNKVEQRLKLLCHNLCKIAKPSEVLRSPRNISIFHHKNPNRIGQLSSSITFRWHFIFQSSVNHKQSRFSSQCCDNVGSVELAEALENVQWRIGSLWSLTSSLWRLK